MKSKKAIKPLNLKNQLLDQWLVKLKDISKFPFEYDYPSKYKTISTELNQWVHPYVNSGAMINDKGYLTDHGPKHIAMLIKRASQFLDHNPNGGLTETEVLVLLLAIHIHDIGNILGRHNHEINAQIIIEHLGYGVAGQDKLIWEMVYEIAKAHKGNVIQNLVYADWLHNHRVRLQLLAAILKFADEIAEDSSRADRFNALIGNIPPEAELYHQYALALTTLEPDIENRDIEMVFNINEEQMIKKYPKKTKDSDGNSIIVQQFFIEEIYLRTLKTHYERLYCMRFMRPLINLDSIKVSLKIRKSDGTRIVDSYELVESGINDVHLDEVYKICPDLKEKTGNHYFEKLLSNENA